MAAALNALGFAMCLAAIVLLLVGQRMTSRRTGPAGEKSMIEGRLPRRWLDLGLGGLVIGFACQVVAWLFWGA